MWPMKKWIGGWAMILTTVGGCGGGSGNINNEKVSLPFTKRVSESALQKQTDAGSGVPAISADGRYVAFSSTASNLVPGDTNNAEDVFVKDLQTGIVIRVSVSSTGAEARGKSTLSRNESNGYEGSTNPSISADGRYVAFQSYANDLVGSQDEGGADGNERADIFVRDLVLGTTRRASLTWDGRESRPADLSAWNGQALPGAVNPSISEDGRHVAFESDLTDLVPGKTSSRRAVYVRDLVGQTTSWVSVNYLGAEPVGLPRWYWLSQGATDPSISGDGRFVAFSSNLTDLVPGYVEKRPNDPNKDFAREIFVRDLKAGTTSWVSVTSEGLVGDIQGSDGSLWPRLSADGRYVAFYSTTSLVPGAHGRHIYLRDRARGMTTLVSRSNDGIQGSAGVEYGTLSLSADARYVAFASASSNLVENDINNATDIFVRDTVAGTTLRASVRTGGDESTGPLLVDSSGQVVAAGSKSPSISADGRFVAFVSEATNLVGADTNGAADIFVRGPLR